MDNINERLAAVEVTAWKRPPGCSRINYLNDWNALKRLEGKAREKGGYTEALMDVCSLGRHDLPRLLAATPEQVAEAILAVLEE